MELLYMYSYSFDSMYTPSFSEETKSTKFMPTASVLQDRWIKLFSAIGKILQ